MTVRARVGVLAGVGLWLISAAAAETLEEAQKAIVAKAAACTSLQSKTSTTQSMRSPDMKYEAQGDMTAELMKKGDKWLYRAEGKNKSVTTAQGQEQKQDGTVLMICDGEFMYVLQEINGEKSAMKNRVPEQFAVLSDQKFFDSLAKEYDLKLLGDETVDGKSTWAIEAASKQPPQPGMVAKMVNYFDKDSGVVIQTIGKDADGKTVLTSKTTDVRMNPTISPDRFVFKAPEGVQVLDLTAMGGSQPAAPPSTQPATKPADAEKKDDAQGDEKKDDKKDEKKDEKKGKLPKLPKLP